MLGRNKHTVKSSGYNSLMSKGASAFGRFFAFFSVFVTAHAMTSGAAFAANDVDQIAENIVESSANFPLLVASFAYLLGILLAITGVIKLKEHVEAPQQTPLRTGLIRLIVGGALFSLPMIFEALRNTIGTDALDIDPSTTANDIFGFIGGIVGNIPIPTVSSILDNVIDSIENVPGLISAVAYLLAIVSTVSALLKLRDHVENPEQTALKEPVIRFFVAGALFALPSIYNAMFNLIGGDGGIMAGLSSFVGGFGFLWSSYSRTLCVPDITVVTAGEMMCNILATSASIPTFLTIISYLMGLVLGIWGILKIRDHVINPQQTGLWDGISRLAAGGLFFTLPIVVEVARNSFTGGLLFQAMSLVPISIAGYNDGSGLCGIAPLPPCPPVGAGLDTILTNFMDDLMGPIHVVTNYFTFVVGMIFLMIGVSRLIKTAQDGARGPGGMGTIMTFVVGAALMSYNELMRAFSTTLFSSPISSTFATLQYDDGMTAAELASAHAVISAILKFVILIGLISFVRGLFIIRGVAEGNQQASIMAGVTHIIAGAAAVNLGPLINAVQGTLGISGYGIVFS